MISYIYLMKIEMKRDHLRLYVASSVAICFWQYLHPFQGPSCFKRTGCGCSASTSVVFKDRSLSKVRNDYLFDTKQYNLCPAHNVNTVAVKDKVHDC